MRELENRWAGNLGESDRLSQVGIQPVFGCSVRMKGEVGDDPAAMVSASPGVFQPSHAFLGRNFRLKVEVSLGSGDIEIMMSSQLGCQKPCHGRFTGAS